MKMLVLSYSRTGNTAKVAAAIAEKLQADREEIEDRCDRSGAKGYLRSAKDALFKKSTHIADLDKNPADYDTIVLGTPVWGFTVAPAVRTFVEEYGEVLQKRRVAFFCTMGSSGAQKTFRVLGELLGKPPIATLALSERTVRRDNELQEQVASFTASLRKEGDEGHGDD